MAYYLVNGAKRALAGYKLKLENNSPSGLLFYFDRFAASGPRLRFAGNPRRSVNERMVKPQTGMIGGNQGHHIIRKVLQTK
jgi:hypothetical protein